MEQKAHSKAIKWAAVGSVLAVATVIATAAVAQEVLPRPEPPFRGKIGRTTKDSKPDFPQEIPEGGAQAMLVTQAAVLAATASTCWTAGPSFSITSPGWPVTRSRAVTSFRPASTP